MRASTASATNRTVHVKCTAWSQVEAFVARKLRRGNLLTARLPFAPGVGDAVTVALELPSQVVFTLDASVRNFSRVEGQSRWWVELELINFTAETQARLRALIASEGSSRQSRIAIPDSIVETQDLAVPADERAMFAQLTADLRRVRGIGAHEVLGVEPDASLAEAKRAWLLMLPRYHPDAVAQFGSSALSHLAEELSIHINRALDRFRTSTRVEGWLIGFEELGTGDIPVRPQRRRASTAPVSSTTEAVEARAKALLADGNTEAAQEHLAGALLAFPRSRPLRVLYYVCGALRALDHGEREFARSQLDAALSHDREHAIVLALVDRMRRGIFDTKGVRKVFE